MEEYKVGEEFQIGFKTLKCVEGPNLGGCWDDYEECLENVLKEVCMMILKGEL